DEYGGLARDRHALGVVERFQLLELLFDPVGDLARHLFGRSARPLRLDHHCLDGEVGIFLTAKLKVGKEACRHEGNHEIPDERTMAERPVGKVERLHGFSSCSIRPSCPGLRLGLPAVTTRAPGASPPMTRPPAWSTTTSIFCIDTVLAG